jgi:hypothetical protein
MNGRESRDFNRARDVNYEIRLKDGEAEVIEGADAYQQEGPLTTFFQTRAGRAVVDCWSRRLASYRTADIVRIRRTGPADTEMP